MLTVLIVSFRLSQEYRDVKITCGKQEVIHSQVLHDLQEMSGKILAEECFKLLDWQNIYASKEIFYTVLLSCGAQVDL